MKIGLQEGAEDEDDVVEEPWVGYYASLGLPPFRRYTISHYWALEMGHTLLSTGGPSID